MFAGGAALPREGRQSLLAKPRPPVAEMSSEDGEVEEFDEDLDEGWDSESDEDS